MVYHCVGSFCLLLLFVNFIFIGLYNSFLFVLLITTFYKPYSALLFNPHLPNGLFHPYILDESISNFRDVSCIFSFFILHFVFVIEIPVSKQ